VTKSERLADGFAIEPERLQPELQRHLALAQSAHGDAPLRVLDFGCGRGETVALLCEQGFRACGVDVEQSYLENGAAAFEARGLSASECLFSFGSDGKLPFPDQSFDFVFTQQVLEHVDDLDGALGEIARVLHPRGTSFHILPARWGWMEEHVRVPLAHWWRPGGARRRWIALWLRCGLGTSWLADREIAESAQAYDQYLVRATRYRRLGSLRAAFARAGLRVDVVVGDHPRLRALPVLGAGLRVPGVRRIVGELLARVAVVELLARPAAGARSVRGTRSADGG